MAQKFKTFAFKRTHAPIMPHLQCISAIDPWSDFAIIPLDGEQCQTLRAFYEHIAEAFAFPEDFGFTIESLDEMLGNLSWLDEPKIAAYVQKSAFFLRKERSESKKLMLLDVLDAICEDWQWAEEEEDFPIKKLVFLFDESENSKQLLSTVYEQ